MSAGFSAKGRDFAAQAADVLFTTMSEVDQAPALLADIHDHVARHGRRVDIYTMSHVVCRPTRSEAEDFYHYFAEKMADADGQAYYRRQRGPVVRDAAGNEIRRPLVNRFMRATGKRNDGAYPGTLPLVGTPDDIVADMVQMSATGLAGTSIAFLDYLKELPYFIQEVLPRLERLGFREQIKAD
jgi:alkanesulfonate monooxygenase SsuD/methylene tetrahydromethanopterin reductase-like flavin-dependent oxidoreductase (luciferase family)